MLLVSPERLNNPGFRDEVLPRLAATCGLLVVDEAHCISDWGHDFRPDYRRIRTLLAELPDGIPVLATTATANQRVTDDVAEQLGTRRRWSLRGSLDRESLRLGVVRLTTAAAAAGLARRPPRRAARLRHRLLPDRRRDPGGRRLPALARPRRRRLLRPDRAHRAARARAGPPRRPGQGAGRDQRARHGLRRDARLRRQPRCAAVAGGLLPAGRPRRPRHRRGHRGAAAGDRGPRHLGLLRLARLPARGAGARDPRRARRPTARRSHRRRSRPTSTSAAPGSRRCSRCSTSTVRSGGSGAAGRRPGEPWTYDADRYRAGDRGPRARAGGDARLPRHRRLPDAVPARAARRPRGAADCGRCDNCGGLDLSTDVRAAAVEAAEARLARPGVAVEPRKMWPTGARQPRRSTSRARSPTAPTEGRAVARLDRPRARPGAARAVPRRSPTARCRRRSRARSSRCSATGSPAPDAIVVRRVGHPAHPEPRPRRGLSRFLGVPVSARFAIVDPAVGPGQRRGQLRPAGRGGDPALRAPGRRPRPGGCCSSTTSSSPAGPSRSRPGRCARPARRRSCRWRSGSAAEPPGTWPGQEIYPLKSSTQVDLIVSGRHDHGMALSELLRRADTDGRPTAREHLLVRVVPELLALVMVAVLWPATLRPEQLRGWPRAGVLPPGPAGAAGGRLPRRRRA